MCDDKGTAGSNGTGTSGRFVHLQTKPPYVVEAAAGSESIAHGGVNSCAGWEHVGERHADAGGDEHRRYPERPSRRLHRQCCTHGPASSPCRLNHLHGFTLIELLVVISIIAVLISILLPALTRARDSARKVQCASGIRQVILAQMSYAQDHDGWFQDSVVWGEANVWLANMYRQGTIRTYLGMDTHKAVLLEAQGATPGPLDTLLCPNHDQGLDRGYTHLTGNGTGTTYLIALGTSNYVGGANWYGWAMHSAGSASGGFSDLRPLPRLDMQSPDSVSPSAQPAMGELWRETGLWNGYAYWFWTGGSPNLRINHLDGANVGFADGHVQFRNSENFTKRITFYGDLALWW